jgi:flagellar capping protein FliD
MGTINLPGLATGIDTASLIKQLMAAESQKLTIYQNQRTSLTNQETEIGKLAGAVSAAKSAAAALSDVNSMAIFSASSSNSDILTAGASSDAQAGSHSVEVNQLAAAEKWIQDVSTFNYKTDYVGGGNFIYSYNHQERVITTVADETTLEDLVNLINNDHNNPGVTASLLSYGGKYHLMLSGQEMGEDYQISVNASSTEVWKPNESQPNSNFTNGGQNADLTNKITSLDQFSGSLAGGEKIIISGKNHSGAALPDLELAVTANTTIGQLIDAINKQFDGIAKAKLVNGQIWLTDDTCGSSDLEISLSYNAGSGSSTLGLPAMAVATEGASTLEGPSNPENSWFLDASSFIKIQNAQSAKIKIDGYPAQTVNEVQTLSIVGTATSGTFKLTLNGETTEAINYNATAADIQSALEALAGVEAGDVYCSGSDLPGGPVTITFGGSLAGMDITQMTVSDSTLDAGVVSVVETVKGNDGWIDRNSNNITDAITGITLNLHDVTEAGKPIRVTVNRNTAAVISKVQSLVKAFNDLMTELKADSEYNTDTKKMGILSNDVAVSFIKTGMRSPFIGTIKGFVSTIDSFVQADDIGISIDGAGMMQFDSKKLSNAMDKDYRGVLEVLGATKSGDSNSTIVKFSSASDKYTTAGTYNVKVTVEGGNITSAKIKLAGESTYRDAVSWKNGVITFDSSFNEKGDPVYSENGLQLSVDLTQDGQYGTDENPIIIRVKQGAAGTLEDLLDDAAKADGRLDTSKSILEEKIKQMDTRIQKEQDRLAKEKDRLTQKYARLEATLAKLQQQMSAAGVVSQQTFTN